MTVKLDFRIRPAEPADGKSLAALVHNSTYIHRHLDWRSPLEWIGTRPFLAAEYKGRIIAALACPPDPAHVAWIRLFASTHADLLGETWQILWEAAQAELAGGGGFTVPVIVLQEWMRPLLTANGFTSRQEIVMLERDQPPSEAGNLPEGMNLRAMQAGDLAAVAGVDAAAFEPVWQNSLDALSRAMPQAAQATVAETGYGIVGYQITTRNPFGAHLARLAVHPGVQRQGVGRALVDDLIRRLAQTGIRRLTVNTQSDNRTSLSLYARTGFVETGERYPVYEFNIP